MKSGRILLCLALAAAGGLSVSYGEPIEMLKHGGFEDTKDGMPVGWQKGNSGVVGVTDKAFQGKYAATFKAVPHEWGFSYFGTTKNAFDMEFTRPGMPVVPGATYEISVMARGTGKIGFLLPMSSMTDFLGSIFSPDWPLAYEWRKYTFRFKIDNPRARSVLAGVKLSGLNAEADIDSVSMTFDPVENPGINPGFSAEVVKTSIPAEIESRNAEVSLLVNGKAVQLKDGKAVQLKDGKASLELVEGYNTIAVEAVAKGGSPGVRLTLPGNPEANGCWRAGAPDGDAWKNAEFDDAKWNLATTGSDGFMWGKAEKSGKAAFRQTILWNKTHYGSNRCMVPPAKEWGFSPDTVETFVMAIYAPQKRPFSSYEFTLELPEGFRLLDITKHQQSAYNRTPSSVGAEKIKRDGMDYTRHRLVFPGPQLEHGKTQYTLLPVKMEKGFKENTRLNFYFHRKVNGNVTELRQSIPVVVMPPVNGKQPKKISIQQYVNMQVYSGRTEPEHIREVARQASKAGLNQACWPSSHANNPAYYDTFLKAYKESGIRVFLWPNENFPLYGMTQMPKHNAPWLEWMRGMPEARARYFNNDPDWNASNITYFGYMFCPSYAVFDKDGRAKFSSLLEKTYSELLEKAPESTGIVLDWETHVWLSKDNVPGRSSWCFCDKCKKRFKEFAGIPATEQLDDKTIMEKHHSKWIDFRTSLEGEIQGAVLDVCKKMGKRYMVYAEFANKPFWRACKGKTDMVFPGLPGNAAATSANQKMIDEVMEFYKKDCGIERVIAQRFSYADGFPTGPDAWRTFTSFSDDGFVNAKSWKSQILRLVATCQGGIDICNSMSYCGGMLYYLGEATRIISEHEDLFYEGERRDELAESAQFKYPNMLVLKKGSERLVLLFNESDKAVETELVNKDLEKDLVAVVNGTEAKDAGKIRLTVPAEDVAVIHLREKEKSIWNVLF